MQHQHESRPPSSRAHRLHSALRRWWQGLWVDEMTAYLSRAENHVDLEYRIRRWNEREPPLL